jgi:hypothetical protein
MSPLTLSRSAPARRRSRRERPAPRPPWALATADGCDVAGCAAFLDRLNAMPRAAWLEIGRRVLVLPAAGHPARAAAVAALDALVVGRRLAVTAWLVRDAVETAFHLARGAPSCPRPGGRWRAPVGPPTDRPLLRAAYDAARITALAHLARPWLSREQYVALLAPFVAVSAGTASD